MKIKGKLASKRGVTLTELLTAVIILAIVTSSLAAGIASSVRVYNDSVKISDSQTLLSTISQAVMDELRYAEDITIGANAVFTSKERGSNVAFGIAEDRYVTLGSSLLVGKGAYSNDDFKAKAEVSFDGEAFAVKVMVYDNENIEIQKAEFTVTPLNG